MDNLSEIDQKILTHLQRDARTKLEVMAEDAATSVATVQRRIRELKRRGVIVGDRCAVDPDKAGFAMTFLILVELERESLQQLDAFRRKMKAEAQVQQCYYITGEADFAIIVLARDMQDFQELTQRLFFDDPNIKRFRTQVVMERTKVGLTVPV